MDADGGEIEFLLGVAEGFAEYDDFAFEAFEVLEGDVEEISGAAGGVEHADIGELLVKGAEGGAGFLFLARGLELSRGGFDGGPLPAQGLDQAHQRS